MATSIFLKDRFRQGVVVVRNHKRISLIVAVILLAFIGFLILNRKQTPQYTMVKASRTTLIDTLTESGNVVSASQASVSSPTSGVIEEMDVKNGDIVASGQTLFKVKSTATDEEKASAYAAYLSAVNSTQTAQQTKQSLVSQLETARKAVIDAQVAVDTMNYNRTNNINNPTTKQPYTQNDIDSINSTLTSARESFSALETKYNQSDTSIGASSSNQNAAWLAYQATQDSEVKAPTGGTIVNLSANVGDSVSGGSSGGASSNSSSSSTSSSSSGSPVLIIADLTNYSIKSSVNEVDVSKVHDGQAVNVTFDAIPSVKYTGTIDSVDTIGTNSQGVVTFNMYVRLSNPDIAIKPGMTASIDIQASKKQNVLAVPSQAIQTINGQNMVRVLKDGQIERDPVKTGLAVNGYTEIIAGISEGDQVVTGVRTTRTGSGTTTSPFGGQRGFGGGFGGGGFGGAVRVGGGNRGG